MIVVDIIFPLPGRQFLSFPCSVFLVPTICYGYTDSPQFQSRPWSPGSWCWLVFPAGHQTGSSSSNLWWRTVELEWDQECYPVNNEGWENKIRNPSKLLSNLHSKYKIWYLFTQAYHYLLVSIWYGIMHVPVGWQNFKKAIIFLVVRNI